MKLKLVEIKDEAKETKSFFFEPIDPITWIPGQYMNYTFPKLNYDDPRGNTRMFTISSSPTEGIIRLTTRIRETSGFKKTLVETPIGTLLDANGPFGTFIFDENETGSHVFLAGGIGVTPYRSFVKYAIDKKLNISMHLICSNSYPEDIVFKEELESFKSNSFFTLDFTISKSDNTAIGWQGVKGRIDVKIISELVKDIENKTFWVTGPPEMVNSVETSLKELNISGEHIKTEKFTGY